MGSHASEVRIAFCHADADRAVVGDLLGTLQDHGVVTRRLVDCTADALLADLATDDGPTVYVALKSGAFPASAIHPLVRVFHRRRGLGHRLLVLEVDPVADRHWLAPLLAAARALHSRVKVPTPIGPQLAPQADRVQGPTLHPATESSTATIRCSPGARLSLPPHATPPHRPLSAPPLGARPYGRESAITLGPASLVSMASMATLPGEPQPPIDRRPFTDARVRNRRRRAVLALVFSAAATMAVVLTAHALVRAHPYGGVTDLR